MSCDEAVRIMQEKGFDQLPVVKEGGGRQLVGMITLGNILSKVAKGSASVTDPISSVLLHFDRQQPFVKISPDSPLASLNSFFEQHSVAFVTDPSDGGLLHVVTKIDLLSFLFQLQRRKTLPAK